MQINGERDFVIYRWLDLQDLDWYVLGPVIALISISFLLLKSASNGEFLTKQLLFLFPVILVFI